MPPLLFFFLVVLGRPRGSPRSFCAPRSHLRSHRRGCGTHEPPEVFALYPRRSDHLGSRGYPLRLLDRVYRADCDLRAEVHRCDPARGGCGCYHSDGIALRSSVTERQASTRLRCCCGNRPGTRGKACPRPGRVRSSRQRPAELCGLLSLPLEALHVHSFTRGRRLRYNFAVNHNFAADFIPASRVFACIEEHLAEVSTTGDDDSLHPRKSLAGCTLKDSISIVEFDKVNGSVPRNPGNFVEDYLHPPTGGNADQCDQREGNPDGDHDLACSTNTQENKTKQKKQPCDDCRPDAQQWAISELGTRYQGESERNSANLPEA